MAFCKNCGNKLEDGTKFCPKCGNPTGGTWSMKMLLVMIQSGI